VRYWDKDKLWQGQDSPTRAATPKAVGEPAVTGAALPADRSSRDESNRSHCRVCLSCFPQGARRPSPRSRNTADG